MNNKKAVLLVAHGSHSADALSEFSQIIELMGQHYKEALVTGASMEINQPDIARAVEQLNEKGIEEILVLPYFLFRGRHTKKDIPQLLEVEQKRFPKLNIKLGPPLGIDDLICQLLIKRIAQTEQVL